MASNAIKTHFKTQLPAALAVAAARVRMTDESDSQFARLAIAELVANRLELFGATIDEIPPEWLAVRAGPKPRKR